MDRRRRTRILVGTVAVAAAVFLSSAARKIRVEVAEMARVQPKGAKSPDGHAAKSAPGSCRYVGRGHGPTGQSAVKVETVVTGLEVPWGIAFLPNEAGVKDRPLDLLVTERPGRIRLVRGGKLLPTPVAEIDAAARVEGGLAGIALHPGFAQNRFVYVYYSYGTLRMMNRVERYRLSPDGTRAEADRVIIEDIPGGTNHDGGRIHFGADGMLYVATGDARKADLSQDLANPAGKILRLTPDGGIPADNPKPKSPVFISGVRNVQAFDWIDRQTLYVVDHGPSGEYGREGHDEVSVARAGENLGWPTIHGCEKRDGLVTPVLTWKEAAPPGGAAIYRGTSLPGWRGDLIVATLRSRHLHRIVFDPKNPVVVDKHEVYFKGDPPQGFGRLREVAMGPDGHLYVTTSNCDGRGTCPGDKDRILRVVPK